MHWVMTEQILSNLREVVLYFDPEEARTLAQKALEMGVDPVTALAEGLAKPLREVGGYFDTGEAFITELIAAAQTMEAGARGGDDREVPIVQGDV